MDIKLTIGGIEATVTVKDAQEAFAFLSQFSNGNAPRLVTPAPAPVVAQEAVEQVNDEPEADGAVEHADPASIRNALLRIRGTYAAKLLEAISRHPEGVIDVRLKAELAEAEDRNWGPIIAQISKACKRFEVPMEAVLRRRVGRRGAGPDRKQVYHYRVTDEARDIMRAIQNFGVVDDMVDMDNL